MYIYVILLFIVNIYEIQVIAVLYASTTCPCFTWASTIQIYKAIQYKWYDSIVVCHKGNAYW